MDYHYYWEILFETTNYIATIRSCCFKYEDFFNPNYIECIYKIEKKKIK
jgi:hypothetical protein